MKCLPSLLTAPWKGGVLYLLSFFSPAFQFCFTFNQSDSPIPTDTKNDWFPPFNIALSHSGKCNCSAFGKQPALITLRIIPNPVLLVALFWVLFHLRLLQHQGEQNLIYNNHCYPSQGEKLTDSTVTVVQKSFTSLSIIQSESTAQPNVPQHQLLNKRFCFRLHQKWRC